MSVMTPVGRQTPIARVSQSQQHTMPLDPMCRRHLLLSSYFGNAASNSARAHYAMNFVRPYVRLSVCSKSRGQRQGHKD